MVNANVEETSEKEKSLETDMICSEPVESKLIEPKTNTNHSITENTTTEISQDIVQVINHNQ